MRCECNGWFLLVGCSRVDVVVVVVVAAAFGCRVFIFMVAVFDITQTTSHVLVSPMLSPSLFAKPRQNE